MRAEQREVLASTLGAPVRSSVPVAGGDVNEAWRVDLDDGTRLFVKTRDTPIEGLFEAEAAGLVWLADAGAVRIPGVVLATAELLALEWIDVGPRPTDGGGALGERLAALHQAGAPSVGLDHDNFIGPLPQANPPGASWPAFYGEHRVVPLARQAVAADALDPAALGAVERLVERLEDLCGTPEPPARLHGDLWAGNALWTTDGQPVLCDPATYGGNREVDLAMMRLFGGFGPAVFAAYDAAWPPSPGRDERIELYQLYPLLVHAVLFGGGYGTRAASVLRRYAG